MKLEHNMNNEKIPFCYLIYFFFSASASALSLARFSRIPLYLASDLARRKVLKASTFLSSAEIALEATTGAA